MERYEVVLEYFYEISRIPTWIFEGDRLIFCPIPKENLREEKEIGSAFEYLRGHASEMPRLLNVSELEIFAFFNFTAEDGKRKCFIAGPVFNSRFFQVGYKKRLLSEYIYSKEKLRMQISDTPIVGIGAFCRFIRAAAAFLQGKIYELEMLKNGVIADESEDKLMDSVLAQAIFGIREEEMFSLYNLENENRFISAIQMGSLEAVTDALMKYSGDRLRAPLTADTRKQKEYEAVALITIATRAAVAGGVDVDTAFSLSDFYFQRIDRHKTTKELKDILIHATRTFCKKVIEAKSKTERGGEYSPRIQRCIRYIRAHLHYSISLEEAGEYLGVNPKYLSRIFFKETGMKFSDFIRRERVKEACVLLKTSDMSYIDIANSLAFSSQSYFIKVFSEVMNTTPQKFRAENSNYAEVIKRMNEHKI